MNVDALQVAVVIGTGLATYVATWATQMRPLNRRLSARDVSLDDIAATAKAAVADELTKLRDDITKLTERSNACAAEHKRHEEAIQRVVDQLQECVKDEEFQAYVATTTGNVQLIGEKLAHATGTMEAWVRSQERR